MKMSLKADTALLPVFINTISVSFYSITSVIKVLKEKHLAVDYKIFHYCLISWYGLLFRKYSKAAACRCFSKVFLKNLAVGKHRKTPVLGAGVSFY